MKFIRSLHLYLGCVFAPMLVFFAISGIWQTFGWQDDDDSRKSAVKNLLAKLSTIHTSGGLKSGSWTSPLMQWFVVLAAVSFILSVVLGIVMAFRYGRGKVVWLSLAGGIAVPVGLVLLAIKR